MMTLPTPSSCAASGHLSRRRWLLGGLTTVAAASLTACGIPIQLPGGLLGSDKAASAAYEQKAARHFYQRYPQRIYHGKLPPMLYAVAVLQIHLTSRGHIRRLHWMRAPSHAPEVTKEIERLVRAAAPFPPTGAGNVTYTETWLWDRSGQFQLDTLSEGQLAGG